MESDYHGDCLKFGASLKSFLAILQNFCSYNRTERCRLLENSFCSRTSQRVFLYSESSFMEQTKQCSLLNREYYLIVNNFIFI